MESAGQKDHSALAERMDNVHMDFLWVLFTGMMRTAEMPIVMVAFFLMVVTIRTQEFTTAVEMMPTPPTP